MDYKKIQESLSEKYRYLFINDFKRTYDLVALEVIDVELDKEKITEFSLDVKIDDTRAYDGDASSIGYMLRQANDDIREFLYKYPVNPNNGRIDTTIQDFMVNDGLFLNFDYKLDESHMMEITFRVSYE